MRRWLLMGLALVAMASASVSAVAAQSAATPAAVASPAVGACTTAPYNPQPLLERLAATPLAQRATPAPAAARPTAPAGSPADQATSQAISGLVDQFIACTNANDSLRLFSLFSEDYLQRLFAQRLGRSLNTATADILAGEIASYEPTPLPGGKQVVLDRIEQVQVLPNGRVSAVVYGHQRGAAAQGRPVLFLFVSAGAGFKIDDVVSLPKPGTPAP